MIGYIIRSFLLDICLFYYQIFKPAYLMHTRAIQLHIFPTYIQHTSQCSTSSVMPEENILRILPRQLPISTIEHEREKGGRQGVRGGTPLITPSTRCWQ